MAESKTYRWKIKDIDCADCAAKLERKISHIDGLEDVSLSFMNETLKYTCDPSSEEKLRAKVKEVIAAEEPDAVLLDNKKQTYRRKITDIDCADCAAKLERKIRHIDGLEDVSLSFMNETLKYTCDPSKEAELRAKIKDVIATEEPDAVLHDGHEHHYEHYHCEGEHCHCGHDHHEEVHHCDEDECHCGHNHEEHKQKLDLDKVMLYRLIGGAILFFSSLFLSGTVGFVMAFAPYVVLGYDVIIKAFKGIGRGQLFDEHFLMTIATFAAVYLGDMKEACGVMLFYQIGEYFQDLAVARSRHSISSLMDIRPDTAVVKRGETWESCSPEDVMMGDIVQVRPGERIPLDGIVKIGSSSLDTSSLTGESKLRDVDPGDQVISGSINRTGLLEVEVTKAYGESTVARILELVENAGERKAKAENFITSFSRIYTPIVVLAAVLVAIITATIGYGWQEGIYRACTFLVISCPCALVISVPLSFFAGIGGLSSKGVLVKGSNLVEILAKTENVVMDKTGTLTSGVFAVEEVYGAKEAVKDAAYAEVYSNHPIAQGIRQAYGKEIDKTIVTDVQEIGGRGLSCCVEGHIVLAGNYKMMQENGIACEPCEDAGTLVYVAKDGVYEGCLVLRDQLKDEAVEAVGQMHASGYHTLILSGDDTRIAEAIGEKVHADRVFAQCLPQDKVSKLEEIKKTGITAFVGDGVNDAPVLTIADTGIAMGGLGSDAAIEAADVVIMDDDLRKIPMAIRNAKRILRTANQNIAFAIIVKILVLIMGAFGIANMWMAIFADTGVAMLCVLNALRLLKTK